MKAIKNYYLILGIAEFSSENVVKKTFRQLALRYHPDKNPGNLAAEQRFKELSEAYDFLSDPHKKKQLDDHLKSQQKSSPTKNPSPKQSPSSSNAGKNLSYHLNLSLEEAFQGGSKTIKYMRMFKGLRETSSLTVDFPSGIRQDKRLRVRGGGESLSQKQTPGDLLITIHIQPHPHFQLIGDDLVLNMPLSPLDFFTDTLSLPTLDSPIVVATKSLSLETLQDYRIRHAGFFLTESSSARGDLVVRFSVAVPEHINENLKHSLLDIKNSLPLTEEQKTFAQLLRHKHGS